MAIIFSDDCTGTFSDKWVDESNQYSASYAANQLKLDIGNNIDGAYSASALLKDALPAAGTVQFKFWFKPNSSSGWYDDDFSNAWNPFSIVNPSPVYSSTNWQYHQVEEFGAGSYKIVLYLRSDTSGKISAGYINAGSRTLLIDESFSYDETNGHDVNFIINFDDEWMELWVDSAQYGSRQDIPSAIFGDIGDTFKTAVCWASYNKGQVDAWYDDFSFEADKLFASVADDFEMIGLVDAYKPDDVIQENFTMSDSIDCSSDSVAIAEHFTMDDECLLNVEVQEQIVEHFNMLSVVDAIKMSDEIANDFVMDDEITAGLFYDDCPVFGNFSMDDFIDAFNWAAWLRANKEKSIVKFIFTLTGINDGKSDAIMKISTLQATKRTDNPTYMSVVVPAYENIDLINERPNGEMVVEVAYYIKGVEELREEFLRVDLTDIRPDEGARNRSVTLTGRKTHSFQNQTVALSGSNYHSIVSGRPTYRFPEVDPFLNPGDTLKVGTDEFRIGSISYFITHTNRTMEVRGV